MKKYAYSINVMNNVMNLSTGKDIDTIRRMASGCRMRKAAFSAGNKLPVVAPKNI